MGSFGEVSGGILSLYQIKEGLFMKIRKSFIVRWLKTLDSNKNELSIIDIEHVQSGDTWRVPSIEDAAETMKKVSNSEANDGQTSADEGQFWNRL